MNQIRFLWGSVLGVFISFSLVSCKAEKKEIPREVSLTQKIGQMLLVGFRGTSVEEGDPIHQMVKEYNLGGVALFNRDLPSGESIPRNIISKQQLKKLTAQLQAIDSIPLWIAIDEEGGFVTRLNPDNGFQAHKSHQHIGQINHADSTRAWAKNMASELSGLGINMNFAPVMDLNINKENPIIGGRERSFSDSVHQVIAHSRIFIQEHKKKGILCVPKHFPGHGSSKDDSHKGLADVTHTWSQEELIPYKTLLAEGLIKGIMTSHVYNERLDTLPATLSPKTIRNLVRKDFGFDGVILSDDMHMRAISNFYNMEESIEKAILAGVDVLVFANNVYPCPKDDTDCEDIPFDAHIAKKAVEHIVQLVEDGIISEERIQESYDRIMALKAQHTP
ncbi:MAG: glycoside hydrolase family 3 protein [Flavobacteriaceae bacterium]